MVFMKLALSDNDMPNRSPIFQTKCRNEGDVRGASIFERMVYTNLIAHLPNGLCFHVV